MADGDNHIHGPGAHGIRMDQWQKTAFVSYEEHDDVWFGICEDPNWTGSAVSLDAIRRLAKEALEFALDRPVEPGTFWKNNRVIGSEPGGIFESFGYDEVPADASQDAL